MLRSHSFQFIFAVICLTSTSAASFASNSGSEHQVSLQPSGTFVEKNLTVLQTPVTPPTVTTSPSSDVVLPGVAAGVSLVTTIGNLREWCKPFAEETMYLLAPGGWPPPPTRRHFAWNAIASALVFFVSAVNVGYALGRRQ